MTDEIKCSKCKSTQITSKSNGFDFGKVIVVFFVIIIVFTGCASNSMKERQQAIQAKKAFLNEQLKTADCGPYPDDFKPLIEDAIKKQLKDPDSAQFDFSQPFSVPVKAYTELQNGTVLFHWQIGVNVNAKNSFGGFAGFKIWFCGIYDNKVLFALPMEKYQWRKL